MANSTEYLNHCKAVELMLNQTPLKFNPEFIEECKNSVHQPSHGDVKKLTVLRVNNCTVDLFISFESDGEDFYYDLDLNTLLKNQGITT